MATTSYTKSKLAIRNTFIDLIREKNIDKISVSEITRKADISRGTFYLHFKDINDLYRSVEDEVYYELEKVFNNYYHDKENLDLFSLTTAIVDYIYDSRDIFFIIMKPHHSERTLRRLRNFCFERMVFKNDSFVDELQQKTRSIFISSGFVGVLEEWLIGGLTIDKDNISKNLNKIISQIQ